MLIIYPVTLLVSHSGGFILFLYPDGRFGGAVKNRRRLQLKATLLLLKPQSALWFNCGYALSWHQNEIYPTANFFALSSKLSQ